MEDKVEELESDWGAWTVDYRQMIKRISGEYRDKYFFELHPFDRIKEIFIVGLSKRNGLK